MTTDLTPGGFAAPEESDFARHVRLLSADLWGQPNAVWLIGRHGRFLAAQEQALRFAQPDVPVLILGETGTGKELFARALYLLGPRRGRPFLSVNCAQYRDNQLIASELFGHRKGSFTGAQADHRGVFEEADGGVVFLDEVGELSLAAQAMLLRVLGEGEIVRVGDSRPRRVDVRVVAATNRDLRAMVARGEFREDLFYRLGFLQLSVPSLRDRGDDWRLLAEHALARLNARTGAARALSVRSAAVLAAYEWPGNVRELQGLMEMVHCLSADREAIEPWLFTERLGGGRTAAPAPSGEAEARLDAAGAPDSAFSLLSRIASGEGDFWSLVHAPFLDREMNRAEARAVVAEGLRRSRWSYKGALVHWGLASDDYLRLMDFLRHHRLKPERMAA